MQAIEQYYIKQDGELAKVFYFRAHNVSIVLHQKIFGMVRGRVHNDSPLQLAATFSLPDNLERADVLEHIASEKLRTRKFPPFVTAA